MPNWCFTNASFKGKPEDILRMVDDIYKSIQWMQDTNYRYCNIGYFLSLSGFDIDLYNRDFSTDDIQLRCSITAPYPLEIEHYKTYAVICPIFESAWGMDYNILYLIALLYNVEFSSYSEEPNMGVYTKCRNGEENRYDFDYCLLLNMDDVDHMIDEKGYCPYDYSIPVFSSNCDKIIEELDDNKIRFTEERIIPYEFGSNVKGVYYTETKGVCYDE